MKIKANNKNYNKVRRDVHNFISNSKQSMKWEKKGFHSVDVIAGIVITVVDFTLYHMGNKEKFIEFMTMVMHDVIEECPEYYKNK